MFLQLADPGNYLLSSYAVPMFAAGVAIACLGFFVLFRERASLVGASFLFMCMTISLFLVSLGFDYASKDAGLSVFWIRMATLGVVFIPSGVLLLTMVLFGLFHRYSFAIAASIGLSLLFALGLFLTDLFILKTERFFWGNYPQYGPLGIAFLVYFFGLMAYILVLYWREYRRSSTEKNKKRIRGLFIALSGGYLGSVDFLPTLGITVYPFGYIPIFFFIITCTYVVIRYRLADITPETAAGEILEIMHGGVIVTDLEGKVRVANSQAHNMIGHLPGSMLGMKMQLIAPIPDELVEAIRTGKHTSDYEMVWPGRNGPCWVSLSASLLSDKRTGELLGIVYVAYDITERKRAEEEMAERGAMLQQIMDTASVAIGIVDSTGHITHANQRMGEMFGLTMDELLGREYVDLIHSSEREAGRQNMLALLASRMPAVDVERCYVRKDGTEFWGHLSCRRFHDAHGNELGLVGVIMDITEHKRMEEELREKEMKYRSLFESAKDGIFIQDETGFTDCNQKGAEMYGLTRVEIIGRSPSDFAPERQPDGRLSSEVAGEKIRTALSGIPQVFEWQPLRADGAPFDVEISLSRLEVGGKMYLQAIVRDMSERKRLEQEHLKTQKLEAIGTLAGGIAHDFNNLLQGVFGYISLAKLRINDREKMLAALEEAEKALHLSVKLTNQLLTFSKGGKPVKKTIALLPVIENAAKFALSGSRTDYRVAVDEGLWQVDADEGQISQVIQNIVLNADQAMPEGGRVEITARNVHTPFPDAPQDLEKGRYVEIAFRDTGIGIPEKYLGKIFDPYFTTKEKGSGLGLATSYSIIKNHNGIIDVKSEMGKGTTFRIHLPATVAVKREEQARPAAAAQGRTGRVLIMDDDSVILDVAGELIRALGHSAEFSSQGKETIAKYREAQLSGRPFDVVILDLTIRGGMGGAETLRILSEIDPGVKAVVSSGYSDDAAIAGYGEQGFKAVLKKPYHVDELRTVLNRLLNS
jgi:two-component system cell cycle sensor histidine kinase/response regulator CckA